MTVRRILRVRRMRPVAAALVLAVPIGLTGCGRQEDHGWTEVGIDRMPDPGRVYLHASAIRKRGGDVYVTHRVVKEADVVIPLSDRAHPLYYRSALFTQHIDCGNRRVRMLEMQFFDQQGRTVESPPALKASVASSSLQPIVEGSIADGVWASTCWSDGPPPAR